MINDDLALRVIASFTMLLFAIFFSGLAYYGYKRGEAPARGTWIKKAEQPVSYNIIMAVWACAVALLISGAVQLLFF